MMNPRPLAGGAGVRNDHQRTSLIFPNNTLSLSSLQEQHLVRRYRVPTSTARLLAELAFPAGGRR
jgi:hypothetical protein